MRGAAQSESGSIPHTRTTLAVENFGPIAKAKVELRPLTVFVGPSNTGKSYLAILIYALHVLFAAGRSYPDGLAYPQPGSFIGRVMRNMKIRDMPNSALEALREWLATDSEHSARSNEQIMLDPLAQWVRGQIQSTTNLDVDLQSQIERCFGLADGIGSLIRHKSRRGISLAISSGQLVPDGSKSEIEYRFRFGLRNSEASIQIPESEQFLMPNSKQASTFSYLPLALLRGRELADEEDALFIRDLAGTLISNQLDRAVGPFARNAYYLPADRTGVMHAHRVVVSSLIGQAASGGLRRTRDLPTLSGVLADFLREIINAGDPGNSQNSASNEIARLLESSVLGGEIESETTEFDYPTFYYRPFGWDHQLALSNSSSMVSELAPVVLYLKHYARPGDTLIIEEPESHLHPAAQANLALILVRLVHRGIRVIVTTHSEWMVDQFTTLTRMSGLDSSRRSILPDGDVALSEADLGIWLFEQAQRMHGSTVKEITINPDEGVFDTGFGAVAKELYDAWADVEIMLQEEQGETSP